MMWEARWQLRQKTEDRRQMRVVGSWGCLREEGRKGVVCESGERVNGEEVYSRGRRDLMRTISGGETMGQTFGHTHGGEGAGGSRHHFSQPRV